MPLQHDRSDGRSRKDNRAGCGKIGLGMGKWKRAISLTKRWTRNQLINKYGAICFYCEEPFANMKEITLDHYLPLSKGGISELENYRLAHFRCNQAKNDMTPEEFTEFQNGRG